jgi:signal transduction histidine kinase
MTTQPQFLTSISHELKNQLAGILSLSEMIKEEFFGKFDDVRHKREYIEAATDINNVANDMLEFVNDLMDVEQNQSGDFSVEMQEVDIAFLIKKVVKVNLLYAVTNNIKIIFDNEQNNLPKLFIDPRRTKQILTNLISNSVKYSLKNTTIDIVIKIENNHKLIISVQDQGIGMTKEQIQMALSGEGSKIDKSSLNQPIDSHGIGMPLVKKLVEAQNGTIEIKSQLGVGTEVLLSFNFPQI